MPEVISMRGDAVYSMSLKEENNRIHSNSLHSSIPDQ